MRTKQNNKVLVGCDVVNLSRFKKAVQTGGKNFLERIFTPSELKNKDSVHLGGIFATKEAVVKALELKPGSWQKMEVDFRKNGRPRLKFGQRISGKIKSFDLSISHDGDYAIAVFVAILK